MGKSLDTIAPIALAVVGGLVGNPELGLLGGIGSGLGTAGGAALGAGLGGAGVNYSQTHNIGSALKAGALSGGGTYLGGQIGGSLLGSQLGTVGSTIGTDAIGDSSSSELGELGGSSGLPWAGTSGAGSSGIASLLGSTGTSAVNSALSTPISNVVGSYVGNDLASQYAPPGQAKNSGNYPFVPSQAAAATAPSSLNSMSSLTPSQQASGLATQGVYGGGNGPQEQSYYGNLINRQLVDSSGNVSPLSSLSPIEQSYNSQLGFGNEANSNSLLQALSKWNPSA